MANNNTLEALVGATLATAGMYALGAVNPFLYAGAAFIGSAIGYKYGSK